MSIEWLGDGNGVEFCFCKEGYFKEKKCALESSPIKNKGVCP